MIKPSYRSLFLSLSLVGYLLATGPSALAQGQRPMPATTTAPKNTVAPKIVVIDINRIYKEHVRFKQQMDQLKNDVESAEVGLKDRNESMRKLAEQLKNYKPESNEYRSIEEKLARDQAQFNAELQLQKKDFLQREAKIYWDVYQEIQSEVASFTRQYGIDLVLRFNSEEVDPNDRQAVLNTINRAIVFENNLDITDQILGRLNTRGGAAAGGSLTRNPADRNPR